MLVVIPLSSWDVWRLVSALLLWWQQCLVVVGGCVDGAAAVVAEFCLLKSIATGRDDDEKLNVASRSTANRVIIAITKTGRIQQIKTFKVTEGSYRITSSSETYTVFGGGGVSSSSSLFVWLFSVIFFQEQLGYCCCNDFVSNLFSVMADFVIVVVAAIYELKAISVPISHRDSAFFIFRFQFHFIVLPEKTKYYMQTNNSNNGRQQSERFRLCKGNTGETNQMYIR